MKIRQFTSSVMLAALVAGLTSCMGSMVGGGMLGGGMMHGTERPTHRRDAGGEHLVQEATGNNLKIVVDFPAPRVGSELTYQVAVTDMNAGHSVSDAHVRAYVRFSSALHGRSQGHEHAAPNESPIAEPVVRRLDAPGSYAFNHQMTGPGTYTFEVIVSGIGPNALGTPLMVSAIREATLDRENTTPGFGLTPTLLVTGAVMLAMMLLMTRRLY